MENTNEELKTDAPRSRTRFCLIQGLGTERGGPITLQQRGYKGTQRSHRLRAKNVARNECVSVHSEE